MKSDKQKALLLAKRQLPELVCDAVNLEGISLTLSEIQALLAGITVNGYTLSDQEIALNQIEAWRVLFRWIENDQFSLSAEVACRLHAVAGKGEALESGIFRSGSVTIAGTDYMPPEARQLPGLFARMVETSRAYKNIYDQAIHVFLIMARCQFFYDVNKRMGRFMMNGILLQAGFPVVNLPAKRQLEFNRLMLAFYASGDQGPMNCFMRSCLEVGLE